MTGLVVLLLLVVTILLVVTSSGRARYVSARRRCPRCGRPFPRLVHVGSDGGEWECRRCGKIWR